MVLLFQFIQNFKIRIETLNFGKFLPILATFKKFENSLKNLDWLKNISLTISFIKFYEPVLVKVEKES